VNRHSLELALGLDQARSRLFLILSLTSFAFPCPCFFFGNLSELLKWRLTHLEPRPFVRPHSRSADKLPAKETESTKREEWGVNEAEKRRKRISSHFPHRLNGSRLTHSAQSVLACMWANFISNSSTKFTDYR